MQGKRSKLFLSLIGLLLILPVAGSAAENGWLCDRGDSTRARCYGGSFTGIARKWTAAAPQKAMKLSATLTIQVAVAFMQAGIVGNDKGFFVPGYGNFTATITQSVQGLYWIGPTGQMIGFYRGRRGDIDDWACEKPAIVGNSVYFQCGGLDKFDIALKSLKIGDDTWGDLSSDGSRLFWVNNMKADQWPPCLHVGSTVIYPIKGAIKGVMCAPPSFCTSGKYLLFSTGPNWRPTGGACYDTSTGHSVWTIPGTISPGLSSDGLFIVNQSQAIAGTTVQRLVAIDAATGAERWSVPSQATPEAAGDGLLWVKSPKVTVPIPADGPPIDTTGQATAATTMPVERLTCYELATGAVKWQADLNPFSVLAYARGSKTIVLTQGRTLFVYDAATGEPVSHYDLPHPVTSAAFVGGTMAVLNGNTVEGYISP